MSEPSEAGKLGPMIEDVEFNDLRRDAFNDRARLYEDGRPGYPDEVFAYLVESCGLTRRCRVLEVGPGTGQATGPLLDAGAEVIAVELGAELGDRLQHKYGDRALQVIVGDFATVELAIEPIDLVCSATAFHWVDPAVGLARAAELLRPSGTVALWWNFFGDPDVPDPLAGVLQLLIKKHAPQLAADRGAAATGANPYALDREARRGEFDATQRFGPVEQRLIRWTAVHTSAEVRALFASFSDWMLLNDSVREPLLNEIEQVVTDEFGGVVERPYMTAIYSASIL